MEEITPREDTDPSDTDNPQMSSASCPRRLLAPACLLFPSPPSPSLPRSARTVGSYLLWSGVSSGRTRAGAVGISAFSAFSQEMSSPFIICRRPPLFESIASRGCGHQVNARRRKPVPVQDRDII